MDTATIFSIVASVVGGLAAIVSSMTHFIVRGFDRRLERLENMYFIPKGENHGEKIKGLSR